VLPTSAAAVFQRSAAADVGIRLAPAGTVYLLHRGTAPAPAPAPIDPRAAEGDDPMMRGAKL